jgi:hypothetical protein
MSAISSLTFQQLYIDIVNENNYIPVEEREFSYCKLNELQLTSSHY